MKRYIRASASGDWPNVIDRIEQSVVYDTGLAIEVTSKTGSPDSGGRVMFDVLDSDGVEDRCGIATRVGEPGAFVIFKGRQSAKLASLDRAISWLSEYIEALTK